MYKSVCGATQLSFVTAQPLPGCHFTAVFLLSTSCTPGLALKVVPQLPLYACPQPQLPDTTKGYFLLPDNGRPVLTQETQQTS